MDKETALIILAELEKRKRLQFNWTQKQAECNAVIDGIRGQGHIPIVLFGGSMAGGKSFYLCAKAVDTCERFANSRGYLCRKEAVVFKRTTLQTILTDVDILARGGWEHKISEMCFTHDNGSRIDYGGLSDNNDREKIKSMNLTFASVDEASEVDIVSARLLETRIGRNSKTKGAEYMLYTSNPEPCWLEDLFVNHPHLPYAFVQSLPSDNPHMGAQYFSHMKQIYADVPEYYEAYINGVWGAIGKTDKVFGASEVKAAFEREWIGGMPVIWGIDVARYGDDKTIVVGRYGNSIKIEKEMKGMSLTAQADMIKHIYTIARNKPKVIAIDDCGVGGGLTDILRSFNMPIYPVNVAEKAFEQEKYRNKKAEITWRMRNALINDSVHLPPDDELKTELLAISYCIKDGRIQIESKDDLKSKIGRSPDKADAIILTFAECYGNAQIAYGGNTNRVLEYYHGERYIPQFVDGKLTYCDVLLTTGMQHKSDDVIAYGDVL